MRIPPPTKPCTFPHCDGRMVLKRQTPKPDRVDEPSERFDFWECEKDDTHIVRAKSGEGDP